MDYPEGFRPLVLLAKKEKIPVSSGNSIWKNFCRVVLIGKGRSEAEISFIMKILKKQLDYGYVSRKEGQEWEDEISSFLSNRLKRIRDEETRLIISGLLRDLFFITVSLKGGARLFEKKGIFSRLGEITRTRSSTEEFIEEIVEDRDVSGIRYAKAILWLQYCGRARDFAPPTRQLKSFLNNDIGPYYSYYEDDEHFMKKAEELAQDLKAPLAVIYRSIFFYRTLKSVLPRGNKFTPKKLMEFMKKNKLSFRKISEMLSDLENREKLAESLYEFMGYR